MTVIRLRIRGSPDGKSVQNDYLCRKLSVMQRIFNWSMGILFLLASCVSSNNELSMNPLMRPFDTPFGVPPFQQIQNDHFMPAFRAALDEAYDEMHAIEACTEEPTFENTVLAIENMGESLRRVEAVFSNLQMSDTNETLDQVSAATAPLLAAWADDVYLSQTLFARVRQIHDDPDRRPSDKQDLRLLDELYRSFCRRGAALEEADRNHLREINSQIASLIVDFEQHVLSETNDFRLIIDDEKDLSGLPEGLRLQAAEWAAEAGYPGKWLFTLKAPSVFPFLTYADNRALRSRIMQAYLERGCRGNDADNRGIVARIVALRAEKARLLGYPHYADYVLEEEMAQHAEAVNQLLDRLWQPALRNGLRENRELQDYARQAGEDFMLAAQDWRYYANKLRQQQFSLSDDDTQPYFELEQVVQHGLFGLANSLYGIRFIARPDLPVYDPEVRVFEVQDTDGSTLGILYMDFYARAGKRAGAWMSTFREQYYDGQERVIPIVTVTYNLPHPTATLPALLTQEEVETLFHEFGHALHGCFSDCRYRSQAGTNVPRDFVEMPSQVMENWAMEPDMLRRYAVHYQTGEVMPDSLIAKIKASAKAGQGFATVEYLAASMLDMAYHTLSSEDAARLDDVEAFERDYLRHIQLPEAIPPRYRSTYFLHLFSHGYAAGYYSYIWAEVLDADAFAAFKESGDLFNRELAESFRRHILSKGYTEEPMELYKAFRGREPSIEPLLERRGLNAD